MSKIKFKSGQCNITFCSKILLIKCCGNIIDISDFFDFHCLSHTIGVMKSEHILENILLSNVDVLFVCYNKKIGEGNYVLRFGFYIDYSLY